MPRGPKWTPDELHTLERFYPHISAQRLTQAYTGRSAKALASMARKLDIRKTEERLVEMGREAMNKRWHPASNSACA